MNANRHALTVDEPAKAYPNFDNQSDERSYLIACEQRGRASLFFMVCGSCVEGLNLCDGDPAAFWAGAWDSLPVFMRRRLCIQFEGFVLCPAEFTSPGATASALRWRELSQVARRFVCRITPELVKFTRERLALILEQAA
jgi:hypothetical protein